jgi:hypothetical protein
MATITDTIDSLDPVPDDPWESGQLRIWFVQGKFASGAQFSKGCKKPEWATETHQELTALVGTQGTFEVEQNGEYRGKPKYKLKAWPGKEPPRQQSFAGGSSSGGSASGGSKSGWQPRYRDSEEGFAKEQRSIYRSVALKHAVESLQPITGPSPDQTEWVIKTADRYYGWLSQDNAASQTVTSSTEQADTPAAIAQSHGLTTGDKVLGAYERYLLEIDTAVQAKDLARLEKLQAMIIASVDKGSLNLDEADFLDGKLQAGKKALSSAATYAAWLAEKKAAASVKEMEERF